MVHAIIAWLPQTFLLVTFLAAFCVSAHAETRRPSFDCSAPGASAPLPRLICSDDSLASADVAFAQAYYALLGESDDAGRLAAKRDNLVDRI